MAVTEEAELSSSEITPGTLREQLAPTEALQHPSDVEEAMCECHGMDQAVIYVHQRAPPTRPDAPGIPPWIADVLSWPSPTVRAWFMMRVRSDDDP